MRDTTGPALYQLSETEALDAMREFLLLHEGHGRDTASDLAALLLWLPDGFLADSAVWIDWLMCIRRVKGLDDSEEAALRDAITGGGWLAREVAARLAKLSDA